MADKKTQEKAENVGGAPGGEPLKDGTPPTGDKPSEQAQALVDQLTEQHPTANTVDPLYNPTTPDGSPPPNNLPGPHGPQGVEHLQEAPATK
jgi:hypothetical protein